MAPPNYTRTTECFTPEAPKNFAVSYYNTHPRLSWSSNGESFPVEYFIYRSVNQKYGNYSLFDSTTDTNYTDNEVARFGPLDNNMVYYYIRTRNNSQGSGLYSASSDTVSINGSYNPLEKRAARANEIILYPNYPNPFNPTTEISYRLQSDDFVSLTIYNSLGQAVRTLVREKQTSGYYNVIWDGKNNAGQVVPSGIYLYRLHTGSFTKTMKMLMVK